jgi:hypothetical protein
MRPPALKKRHGTKDRESEAWLSRHAKRRFFYVGDRTIERPAELGVVEKGHWRFV